MTSATVLFAMLPLALKLQEGGESRAPLAVVIMGGVISSTLLTLVLVPAVYTILDDLKVQLGRLTGVVSSFRAARTAEGGPGLAAGGGAARHPRRPDRDQRTRTCRPGVAGAGSSGDRPSPSGRRRIRVVAERARPRLA